MNYSTEATTAWNIAHSECDHFNGKCYHADPNYIPTPHAASCKCDVCGHCDECHDGTDGPIGSYCLACHRTQRPELSGAASVPSWMTVQRTNGENTLLSGKYRWQPRGALKCGVDL